MAQNLFKALRRVLGAIFILLGILGFLIPIIQGWFFFLIGLFLVDPELAKKAKEKWKAWRERKKERAPFIEEQIIED